MGWKYKPETYIKNYVEDAIRSLTIDNPEWNPGKHWNPPTFGAQYQPKFANHKVIFTPKNRFQNKTTYLVGSKDFGLWCGNLNGATYKNVGQPHLIYTAEDIQHMGWVKWDENNQIRLVWDK